MTVEINSIKADLKDGLFTCYYPKYYAEWFVDYRTVVGDRREKVITVGDGVSNQIGFSDSIPVSEWVGVGQQQVIAKEIDEGKFRRACFETLKKHYIYRRRSFRVPEIEWVNTFLVYVPYQIKPRKKLLTNRMVDFLYEPQSKHFDKLKNYLVIEEFYRERGVPN